MFHFFISTALAASLCASAPYGIPADNNLKTIDICHTGYFTKYSPEKKDPAITVWTITSQTAVGCGDRMGNFSHDPMANNQDANPSSYDASGYDRGHMADAKDFTYNDELEKESFYMTNMVPQDPGLNRGGWKWLEGVSRQQASKYGEVVVYSGPIFGSKDDMMGNVDVPDFNWKIVYIPTQNIALSVIVPNEPISGQNILKYIVSVNDIEARTGYTIPLPSKFNKASKANRSDWKPDFGGLMSKQEKACKK